MEVFSALLLGSTVLILLLVLGKRKAACELRLPPGPTALPLLGNLHQINKQTPARSFTEWAKQFGNVITVYLGPVRLVVLAGYETVKEALTDQADDFGGRASVPFMDKTLRGYGLVTSNGERWRQLRRFTLTTLRDFGMGRRMMETWIQEESRHLVESLKETKSAPIEPTCFLGRAVSNVICALVFGQRFTYDDKRLLRLLEFLSDMPRFGSRPSGQLYNIFPWLMDHLPGPHKEVFKQMDEMQDFIMEYIKKHEKTLNPGEPRDFIDCFLIRMSQEKDVPSTEFIYENLVATSLNLFFAGTETTSTTLRYALMLLIKYPQIQEQMQSEIDTVIGNNRWPVMEDRKALHFTNAVIHEVQRFLDFMPFSVPHAALHDISFKGYVIPKGTVIIPMLHSVLMDEDHWETPSSFNPQHFLDQNGSFKPNPAFLPFSAGKRVCAGESLARMELFLFLVTLLRHFTFSSPGGPDSVDISPECSSFGNIPRKYELIVTPR